MKAQYMKRNGTLFSYEKVIRKYMEENSNCRLRDVREYLKEQYNKHVSLSTICRYLRLLGISYKKITFRHYTDWNRLIEQKRIFEEKIKTIPKNEIISLDESYFYRRMIRSYGYSKVGKNVLWKIGLDWKSTVWSWLSTWKIFSVMKFRLSILIVTISIPFFKRNCYP